MTTTIDISKFITALYYLLTWPIYIFYMNEKEGELLKLLTLLVPFVTSILQRQADWTVVPRTVLPVRDDLSG